MSTTTGRSERYSDSTTMQYNNNVQGNDDNATSDEDCEDHKQHKDNTLPVFSRIRINDTHHILPEWLEMNATLKNLAFDILGASTITDLEEAICQKVENNANYYFNIPLPFATDDLVLLLLKFTEYHSTNRVKMNDETLSDYDINFINDVLKMKPDTAEPQPQYGLMKLFELYTFADYVANEQLLTVCAIHIAQNEISGLTIAELRKKFNIKNDLTPEEEQQIMEQTKWIDEYK